MPGTRWTRDTETAFLLALKESGQVGKAARAIGRTARTAQRRRAADDDFAGRWDDVMQDCERRWCALNAPDAPVELAVGIQRIDGWTPLRRRAFLRALSETGEVRIACERVKISRAAAYRLRARHAGFATEWDAALDRSAPILEQIAWERAVEGWDEAIVVKGEVVGTQRRYSEGLLRTLMVQQARREGESGPPKGPEELRLNAIAAARAAGGAFVTRSSEAATDAYLRKQLDALAKRLRRGREAAAEEEPRRPAPPQIR